MFIDTHCHLDFPQFAADLEAVLERARARKVTKMISICCQIKQMPKILSLVEQYPELYCSVGSHPCSAIEELDIAEQTIMEFAAHPKVVALGEVGLDYYHSVAHVLEQKQVFSKYIRIARALNLPLIIHTRQCDEDMGAILTQAQEEGEVKFILHSFASDLKLAEKALALGGYISFSGIITFKNAETIRQVAAMVPHDRLLIETDAPYLAPVPHRGQRNEPAFVVDTAHFLADLLGLSVETIGSMTSENAHRIFTKL